MQGHEEKCVTVDYYLSEGHMPRKRGGVALVEGNLSTESNPCLRRVLRRFEENSKWLSIQARHGFESSTSRQPTLRAKLKIQVFFLYFEMFKINRLVIVR